MTEQPRRGHFDRGILAAAIAACFTAVVAGALALLSLSYNWVPIIFPAIYLVAFIYLVPWLWRR